MIPRTWLSFLVAAFAILIVTFAVLMGGYGVAASMRDGLGAELLWRVAMGCLILLVITLLLLVGSLGVWQIQESQRREPKRPRRRPN